MKRQPIKKVIVEAWTQTLAELNVRLHTIEALLSRLVKRGRLHWEDVGDIVNALRLHRNDSFPTTHVDAVTYARWSQQLDTLEGRVAELENESKS